MRVYEILNEGIVMPPNIPNTITLWHGGDLTRDKVKFSFKRSQHGPGLYLITRYDVAKKYSGGGRKLYMVTIAKGNDIGDIILPMDSVVEFINLNVLKAKRAEVLGYVSKYGDEINARYFLNIVLNSEAVNSSKLVNLKQFLIDSGVDYELVNSPFGWGDSVMVVLYNMDKIVDTRIIKPGDKIVDYNLPMEFRV